MRFHFLLFNLSFLLCLSHPCIAQTQKIIQDSTSSALYEKTFQTLKYEISTNGSFKNAVLEVENVFYKDSLNVMLFDTILKNLATFAITKRNSSTTNQYNRRDTIDYLLNAAIFSIIHDSSFISNNAELFALLPFTYNFTDPQGRKDWSNMFVTKLLATHQGNCHSLAYLYKILADEIGAKCWLSLAPGHIYIKNYSEKIGWYNTELTSGTFPTDAWVMVTGYVNPEAIKSGLYMDTLSNQQSIALCVLDLAKEYEFQTHNYYDGFILKCCELVLQYHSVNPMALLLKAETLKKVWLKETENKYPKPTSTPLEMQNAYITLVKLGYREMPEKMYQQWLKSIIEQKDKYDDAKVRESNLRKKK